jgi:hypothetical protein
MIKLFNRQSFVLLLLFSCSFFSCEQLLEVVKPTPPKNQTCRVTRAEPYGYEYDNTGKLIALTNFGNGPGGESLPMKLEYNEKGQISKGVFRVGDAVRTRTPFYNEAGKVSKFLLTSDVPTEWITIDEYAYRGDTVYRTHTNYQTYTGDTVTLGGFKTISIFENGNLVRIENVPTKFDSVGFVPEVKTFEYSQTPNKLYEFKNQVLPILEPYDPLQSKMLPSKYTLYRRGQIVDTFMYDWIFNEQGYPLNNGRYPGVTYKYECK